MAKHTLLPIICAGALLFSACGKTSESADKSTEKDLSGQISEAVDDIKNEVSEDLFKEVNIWDCNDEKILSTFNGRDVYRKEFEDANDEYNSKATDISQFDYNFGNSTQRHSGKGEISIYEYLGEEENVVIPSIIEGRIVTYVSFRGFEGVKNVTIPDTVYRITDADNITSIENINYNGTLISCSQFAFSKSPVIDKLTNDGLTILGKSLIMCTSTEKEINIPEGIESITDSESLYNNQFAEGPEVINFPSTFKYLYISFPESLQRVNTKSDFEEIIGGHLGNYEEIPYMTKVEDGIYTFNNYLMSCYIDDPERDLVIPENINRVCSGAIYGNYHSITFEANDIVLNSPFMDTSIPEDRANVGTITIKNNAKKISLNISGINKVEQINLPSSVDIFNGNIVDYCDNITLPSKVNYLLVHNPEECDNYQDHINYAKESGATVIHQ